MIAGREDFLRHDKVRGLTCFFQFLSEPDDLTALAVCLKLYSAARRICRRACNAF